MGSKGKSKGKGKDNNASKSSGNGKSVAREPRIWVEVKPTVLVTGASGFVAGHVIQTLLEQKYKVRGTVRSLDSAAAKLVREEFPSIELFAADLLGGPEAFAEAMIGCKYVQHVASPFVQTSNDPQKDLVDPSVRGIEVVMQAAVTAGIKRIVVTSSIAAVGPPQDWISDPSKADTERIFTEDDWNTTSSLEADPYAYSKVLAEKKALEIAEKADGLSLVLVNPSFVIGPMRTGRADGTSFQLIKAILDGSMKEKGCAGGVGLGYVDVRDVAAAHVVAMQSDTAAGKRFLCTSEVGYSHLELADMIRDRFKAYPVPTEGGEVLWKARYSNDRAKKELNIKFRPVDVSMRDMAKAAIRFGLIEKKKNFARTPEAESVPSITLDSGVSSLKASAVATEEGQKKVEEERETRKDKVRSKRDAAGIILLIGAGDSPEMVVITCQSRRDNPRSWELPKGGIKAIDGDSYKACASRELKEESGVANEFYLRELRGYGKPNIHWHLARAQNESDLKWVEVSDQDTIDVRCCKIEEALDILREDHKDLLRCVVRDINNNRLTWRC